MTTQLKVNHTADLNVFKKPSASRQIDEKRIERIATSMSEDGLFPDPIIVTSEMYVIDGWHRVEAAKIAGKGIYYIVDKTIANTPRAIFNAVKKLNVNKREWKKEDYLHGYSVNGVTVYKELDKFTKDFPMFTLTEQLMLLNNSGTKHADKRLFANGEFEVDEKQIKVAKTWAKNLLELKPYFSEQYNKSVFVRALLTIMEKKPDFKFEDFIKKVKANPGMLKHQSDKRSYAKMIERVYNTGRKTKVHLPAGARA